MFERGGLMPQSPEVQVDLDLPLFDPFTSRVLAVALLLAELLTGAALITDPPPLVTILLAASILYIARLQVTGHQ
jgi:hypothetical protein